MTRGCTRRSPISTSANALEGCGRRLRDRGAEASPRNVDLKMSYASALLNAGGRENVGKARDVLNDVMARVRRRTEQRALYLLSQAERRAGDLDAAEATARRAHRAEQQRARGATSRWRRRSRSGSSIRPSSTRWRRPSPSSAPLARRSLGLSLLLPHLGFAYSSSASHDKAIAAFDEAHRLAPDDPLVTAI